MRRSDTLLATSHEAPEAGTTVVTTMRRAGLIRQFGSGLYGLAPTGDRVRRKIVDRIETAMAAVGAQRVNLPALQYSDDWRASGRWENFENEMFTLSNRDDQAMCLAPSHEEGAVRLLDGAIRSHDDLPVTVYQIARKCRDDHARNGLVRCKEFVMKDAYGVHANRSSLDETYDRMREAYVDTFENLGLDVAIVPANNSVMGGNDSEEFVAPGTEGSDCLVSCRSCRFGRTDEHAEFDLLGIPATVAVGNHYRGAGEVEVEYQDGASESVGPEAVPERLTEI